MAEQRMSGLRVYHRRMRDDLLTRRSFMGKAAASSIVGAIPVAPAFAAAKSSTYLQLLRPPDRVTAYAGLERGMDLAKSGPRWQASAIDVDTSASASRVTVRVSAPGV